MATERRVPPPDLRKWLALSTCVVLGLLGVIYAYGARLLGS